MKGAKRMNIFVSSLIVAAIFAVIILIIGWCRDE